MTAKDRIKRAYGAGVDYFKTNLGAMTIEQYYLIRLSPEIIQIIYKEKENGIRL